MTRFPRAAWAALFLAMSLSWGARAQDTAAADADEPAADTRPSALDAELFYQLLLGELNAEGESNAGFALIFDAARKTNDPALYQRAVELAFRGRSGESALQAARAWKQAYPKSREANRFVLLTLVVLNRVPETVEPLRSDISLADAKDRPGVIASIPRTFARVSDKKQAAQVVERALADYLASPTLGAEAWTVVGQLRMAAGDPAGALEAARQGQQRNPAAEGPVLLALELMDPQQPVAELLVRKYMEGKPLVGIRMAYARALLEAQRYPEALVQLKVITTEQPEFAEAWLVQGTLLVQDNMLEPGEAALKRYLELTQAQRNSEERGRAQAQAYLSLAQIAEKRGDFAMAGAWLDRIDNPQDLVAAQTRRASILARQGKLEEGRKLIRELPERAPTDARMKLLAEVQLLRDNKQYRPAYDLLGAAAARDPKDTDLAYDQAMLAEKVGEFDAMERLLRQVMTLKPDYHHAYNALGYSFADRNIRLPEAKQLIQKALEFAPGDPFISDSLAWVEFRMGNKAEALKILDTAYRQRPDAEIAAHLGEVLWSLGQADRAKSIWREGMLLNAENETLVETLTRLQVKP